MDKTIKAIPINKKYPLFNMKILASILVILTICINIISVKIAMQFNFPILVIASLLILISSSKNKYIVYLLLGAFTLRLGLMGLAEVGLDVGLPGRKKNAVAFLEDGYSYYLNYIKPQLSTNLNYRSEKWVFVIKYIYIVFCPNYLIVLLFNCLLGTLCVHELYKVTKLIWHENAGFVASSIYAFLPYIAALAGVALREMVIILPALISFLLFLKWYEKREILLFFKSVVAILVAILFHGGMVALFLLYIYIFARESISFKTVKGILTGFIGVIALALMMLIAFKLEVGRSKLGFFYRAYDGTNETHETFAHLFEKDALSKAKYRDGFNITSPEEVALNLPKIFIPFFYTPYPWMISFLAYFNGILSIILTVLFMLYRKQLFKNKYARIALVASVLIMFIYAVGTLDHAAAVRHRSKAIPFLLMAFAPFFAKFFHFLTNYKKSLS